MVEEVNPADTHRVNTDALVRFEALKSPVMHEVDCYTHYFFVPNRIIYDDWENFITTGERGDDTSVAPYITTDTGFEVGSLADYMGCPTGVQISEANKISALPFRAYVLILNEWYRQQDLQDPLSLSTTGGLDTTTDLTLYNRNWNKDYFTSCLPDQQKGDDTFLPLEGNAPIIGQAPVAGLGTFQSDSASSIGLPVKDSVNQNLNWSTGFGAGSQGSGTLIVEDVSGIPNVRTDADATTSTLEADLSQVTAATINDLRIAFQVQRYKELNMRSGTRYTEYLRAHYGVKPLDMRLQRPEFLGGGRTPVVFNEVLQTSETATTPQGNYAGHGFSAHRSHQFTKSFSEHGWIIGLMSIMPKTEYASQGIPRKFTRFSPFEYHDKLFEHLGEQAVFNKELYVDNTAEDAEILGYQPQFQELRKNFNRIAGQFRTSLNYWTFTRRFDTRPNLNAQFINCNPTRLPFAITDESAQLIYVHLYHKHLAIRFLSKRGTPGYIDH